MKKLMAKICLGCAVFCVADLNAMQGQNTASIQQDNAPIRSVKISDVEDFIRTIDNIKVINPDGNIEVTELIEKENCQTHGYVDPQLFICGKHFIKFSIDRASREEAASNRLVQYLQENKVHPFETTRISEQTIIGFCPIIRSKQKNGGVFQIMNTAPGETFLSWLKQQHTRINNMQLQDLTNPYAIFNFEQHKSRLYEISENSKKVFYAVGEALAYLNWHLGITHGDLHRNNLCIKINEDGTVTVTFIDMDRFSSGKIDGSDIYNLFYKQVCCYKESALSLFDYDNCKIPDDLILFLIQLSCENLISFAHGYNKIGQNPIGAVDSFQNFLIRYRYNTLSGMADIMGEGCYTGEDMTVIFSFLTQEIKKIMIAFDPIIPDGTAAIKAKLKELKSYHKTLLVSNAMQYSFRNNLQTELKEKFRGRSIKETFASEFILKGKPINMSKINQEMEIWDANHGK